jgi:hypothetical protein
MPLENEDTGWMKRVTVVVTAIILPIILFLLGNRRTLTIACLFLAREVTYHWRAEVGLLGVGVLVACAIGLQGKRSGMAGPGLLFQVFYTTLRQTSNTARILAASAMIPVFVICGQYMIVRYKIFSEVHFPATALSSFESGNVTEARHICVRYAELFPRRGPKGNLRDPFCGGLLDFTSTAFSLHEYVRHQRPAVRQEDGISLPIAWEARTRALNVLERWAGSAAR